MMDKMWDYKMNDEGNDSATQAKLDKNRVKLIAQIDKCFLDAFPQLSAREHRKFSPIVLNKR